MLAEYFWLGFFLVLLFAALATVGAAKASAADAVVMPSVSNIDEAVVVGLPTLSSPVSMTHEFQIWNASGAAVVSGVTGASAAVTVAGVSVSLVTYTPTIAGTLVFLASEPTLSAPVMETSRVAPMAAGVAKEATMYYLTSGIARSDTWLVSNPIERTCPVNVQSAQVEALQNTAGVVIAYRVSLYDYRSASEDYVQLRWQFLVETQSEVDAILARGVPDGNTARYTTAS